MSRHKIVAFRLIARQGELTLETIGASPRGTKFVVQTAFVAPEGADKKVLDAGINRAVTELWPAVVTTE